MPASAGVHRSTHEGDQDMISIGLEDPRFAPLFMIVPAVIMVLLLALTMRSVILRERAMVRQNREDPDALRAYERRWRNHSAA